MRVVSFFFFNDTATTEIYTLSLHDALPISKGFYCFRPPGSSLAQCLDKNKGRQHPKMKPDTRRKLYEYFRPKNKEFFRKIGEEFDWDITLDD